MCPELRYGPGADKSTTLNNYNDLTMSEYVGPAAVPKSNKTAIGRPVGKPRPRAAGPMGPWAHSMQVETHGHDFQRQRHCRWEARFGRAQAQKQKQNETRIVFFIPRNGLILVTELTGCELDGLVPNFVAHLCCFRKYSYMLKHTNKYSTCKDYA